MFTRHSGYWDVYVLFEARDGQRDVVGDGGVGNGFKKEGKHHMITAGQMKEKIWFKENKLKSFILGEKVKKTWFPGIR